MAENASAIIARMQKNITAGAMPFSLTESIAGLVFSGQVLFHEMHGIYRCRFFSVFHVESVPGGCAFLFCPHKI